MPLSVGELFVKLNLDSGAFTQQLNSIQSQLKALESTKYNIQIGVNVADGAIAKIQSDLQGATSAAGQAGQAFNSMGNLLKGALAVSIGNVLTQPLMSLLGTLPNVITTTADFEHGLSQVSAVAGVLTDQQLEQLRVKALEIGRDTSLSATQATEAFQQLVKHGVEVNDQFGKIADNVVHLALATGSDFALSTQIATDTMNAFNVSAGEMDTVVNQITGVLTNSKLSINDYGLALANGGIQTAQMGVSVADFNAAMAANASYFKSGRTEGTSFAAFINALTPNTKVATEAMKELGLITKDGTNVFYDQDGQLKSLNEIYGIIQQTFGNMSEAQYSQYTQTIFGATAMGTLTAAVAQGSKGLDEYAKKLGATSAADITAERMNNLEGQVEILRGSLETLAIDIGSHITPALQSIVEAIIPIINVASDMVEALGGSSDAFARLSPEAQTFVTVLESIAQMISQFVSDLQTGFNNGLAIAEDFFSNLIGQAGGWGSNVGEQFAAGIEAAIASIVPSLQAIGDTLEYWLAPGSPPRIAPDLDTWGKEVGEVYLDSLSDADFKKLDAFTSAFRDVLQNAVDSGQMTDSDLLTNLIGGRAAFASALGEIENLGRITEGTLNQIMIAAGPAQDQVQALLTTFTQMSESSRILENAENRLAEVTARLTIEQKKLKEAQDELSDAQKALDDATKENQRTLDYYKQLDALDDLNESIQSQRNLLTAVGLTDEQRIKAQRKLEELLLKQAIIQSEIQYQPAIDAAQDQVDAQQENVDAAQDQVDRVQEQVDLAKAQLDASKQQYEAVLAQIDAQKKNNELVKEQIDLIKKQNEEAKKGGGGGGKKDTDEATKAQEAYAYSILDSAGKVDFLKNKLAGLKEGTKEYYDTAKKLADAQKDLDKENEKDQKKADKELQDKLKAQRDYNYSIADNAGKMAILREELSKLTPDTKDYYDKLKEISDLQETMDKKKKGSGVGGLGPGQDKKTEDDPTTLNDKEKKDLEDKYAAMRLKAEEERNKQEILLQSTAKGDAQGFLGPLDSIVASISQIFTAINTAVLTKITELWAQIQAPFMVGLTAVVSIFTTFGQIIASFWQQNGDVVLSQISTVWNNIWTIISGIVTVLITVVSAGLATIAAFILEHKETILSTIQTTWDIIYNVINGVLALIAGLITAVMQAVNGDWSGAWQTIQNTSATFVETLIRIVNDFGRLFSQYWSLLVSMLTGLWQQFWGWLSNLFMQTLAAIIGQIVTWIAQATTAWTNFIATTTKMWNDFWAAVSKTVNDTVAAVLKAITDNVASITTAIGNFITDVTDKWNKFWSDVVTAASTQLGNVLTELGKQIDAFKNAAVSLGSAIIDGFIKGMSDGLNSVIEKAKSIASAAIKAAQDALDSHSPSKVMMAIGGDFTEGFAMGIQDTADQVKSAANAVTNMAIPTQMPLGQTPVAAGITNYNITIDARGSAMNEDQFRKIIKDELDVISTRGNNRGRF